MEHIRAVLQGGGATEHDKAEMEILEASLVMDAKTHGGQICCHSLWKHTFGCLSLTWRTLSCELPFPAPLPSHLLIIIGT